MITKIRKDSSSLLAIGLLLTAATLSVAAFGQTELRTTGSVNLVQTWSSNKIIYSGKSQPADKTDPRYVQSMALRTPGLLHGGQHVVAASSTPVDWAVSLGPKATSRGMAEAEFPAKYTFNAFAPLQFPASCNNDFVLYTISTPGATIPAAGVQANIVALNNLYTGNTASSCPNGPGAIGNFTAPTFMFSYAVDDGGVFLSPELSLDAKKVAFVVSSVSRSRAILEVLTWKAGQGTNASTGAVAPGSGSSVVALDYTNSTATGCSTIIGADNYGSSPYVDYTTDGAFIGANNGRLYHVSGVFKGTPTVDYCIQASALTKASMTSPVYDAQHGKVYISDGKYMFAYTFSPTSGFTLSSTIQVGFKRGLVGQQTSIVDSPAVDPYNGWVYAASAANTTNTNPIVSQMPLDLSSHVDMPIGNVVSTNTILGPNFDYAYLNTGTTTGSIYACGTQPGKANQPALYGGNFTSSGVLNTTPTLNGNVNINNGTVGRCSPITTFFDGTHDRLYLGVGTPYQFSGANEVTMWTIDSPIISTSATPTATATGMTGGTSAFVIDNVDPSPGAKSIYFGTRWTSPTATPCGINQFCAVKVSQDTLQ